MAFSISNVLSHRPSWQSPLRLQRNNNSTHFSVSFPSFPSSSPRFIKIATQYRRVICGAAASAAGSSSSDGDLNPYEILGVNPIEGFDMVKAAYTKKRKDAERRGDEATAALLEKAYDKIMMAQLTKRKKGEIFGSFKVSKDIKYADKGPIVPWGPRYSKSEVKDIRINLAISAAFCAWNIFVRSAALIPLQFMSAVFVFRIFEKLSSSESPTYNEEGEDENRMTRMGRRLLRSCGLVFGCIAIASVTFTLTLNLIEFTGNYIPALLYNSQDIFVTVVSAVLLYITASYYR